MQKKHSVKVKPLPNVIRTELNMCCALCALSALKEMESMQIQKQWDWVGKFAHGQKDISPGQLSLLAKEALCYRDLFSTKTSIVTNKNGDVSNSTKLYKYMFLTLLIIVLVRVHQFMFNFL